MTPLTLSQHSGRLTLCPQVNRLEKGHDTNVSGVWKEGVNGAGVTVAVVDDGNICIFYAC
jgi:subtilisin family serine protease